MKAIKLRENLYWVGVIDWELRNFHGYLTQRGSTYNAYLVIDEKITLIDNVKAAYRDEMFSRISDIIDPSKIEIHISNHVEMDHSGSLPWLMEKNPAMKIYTSPQGMKGLKEHYKKDWDFQIVKTGDTVSLGKRSLQFINTPMVHWPDNMVCYMPEDKILFSNDSFGQHYATSNLLDVDNPLEIILDEAKKYYANIVLPYNAQVVKEYEAVKGFPIEMIATSHGVVWTKYIPQIIENYANWMSNKTRKKAVIIYDTMWGSTKAMAYGIFVKLFQELGYEYEVFNLQNDHISDIMTRIIDAEYIVVGSPTLNSQMLPTVAAFLTYLKGLSPKGRKAIAFGSYGWGGQSLEYVSNDLKDCGFELIDTVKFKYIPTEDDLNAMKEEVKAKIK